MVGLDDSGMRSCHPDSLNGHLQWDRGAQRDGGFRLDCLPVDQSQMHVGCDRCQDQQPFQLGEILSETSTSTRAEGDIAIGCMSRSPIIGKSLRVKSIGIREPARIAMQTPGTDEDRCAGWQDGS